MDPPAGCCVQFIFRSPGSAMRHRRSALALTDASRTRATSQRTRVTTAMRTAAQVIGHAASGSSPAPCGRAVYAFRSSLMTRV